MRRNLPNRKDFRPGNLIFPGKVDGQTNRNAACAAAITLGKVRPRKTVRDQSGRTMLLYELPPGFYTGSSDTNAPDSFISASQQDNSRLGPHCRGGMWSSG